MFRINTWWNIVTPNLTEVRHFPVSLVERKRSGLKQGALSWPAVRAKKYWLVGRIACVACHRSSQTLFSVTVLPLSLTSRMLDVYSDYDVSCCRWPAALILSSASAAPTRLEHWSNKAWRLISNPRFTWTRYVNRYFFFSLSCFRYLFYEKWTRGHPKMTSTRG